MLLPYITGFFMDYRKLTHLLPTLFQNGNIELLEHIPSSLVMVNK